MKVLDLQCGQQHVFEGWFASEADFLGQLERALVQCPICGDATITKRLSAPRLNLSSGRGEASNAQEETVAGSPEQSSLQADWMAVTRHILATTDDVGTGFAEEARKIHYGESKARGIRGHASRAETVALIDEGIAVMPLTLPEVLKGRLQ